MDLGLKGRRVLVTGGSQGIGLAVARGFLDEGARVTIVARHKERLAQAVVALSGGAEVTAKSLDLAQRGAPEALADEFRDTDVLVNNAGAIPPGDIFAVEEARWRATWDLKVFGYVNLMRAMYAHMRGRGPKVIVNVLGLGGERPQWRYVCGNAANVALAGVTKSLGGRSIDDGIRVVGVNPGAVETERLRRLQRARAERELGDPERWREFLAHQPLGRAATPDEICKDLRMSRKQYAEWLDESRPVTLITIDHTGEDRDSEGHSLHEVLADESVVTGRESAEKQELVELLTQRISEMPDIPRKILAMYYFENMRLAEIAAVFGLTESRICQIHSQSILGLRAFLGRARNS
jgi:3-oxoacyl-[acyl-carrier protein] reductase